MTQKRLHLLRLGTLGFVALLLACNASPRGIDDVGDGGLADDGGGGGGPRDMRFDNDAFFINDPPPAYCGPDGGMPPVVPGGTPECPDDKNRMGCPCTKPGMSAPCWPGKRANRNLGICKDGVTTCRQEEVGAYWGPCEGYILPDPNATSGKAACQCFSAGRWDLRNTSPCFIGKNGVFGAGGAVSTVIVNGKIECPPIGNPPMKPTSSWSPNTIKVDCAGRFKLCYTLKAGKADNPQPGDCVMAQVCTEGYYDTVNVAKAFPDLPSWLSTSPAQIECATRFAATGGYGEMSVDGKSVTCDQVGPKVFQRVQYCPLKCNQPGHEMDPECKNCVEGGGGDF
jgi:hypothetical protein